VVSVLKDVLAFYSIFPRSSPTKNDSKHTKRKKTQNKTEITEMTDTARPPPMSEIPPVSASAALKMNSGGGGGGPDDVVAVAALIDELKVRFDYSLIGFFFFPMMVLVF
jgi:hypothetical protein